MDSDGDFVEIPHPVHGFASPLANSEVEVREDNAQLTSTPKGDGSDRCVSPPIEPPVLGDLCGVGCGAEVAGQHSEGASDAQNGRHNSTMVMDELKENSNPVTEFNKTVELDTKVEATVKPRTDMDVSQNAESLNKTVTLHQDTPNTPMNRTFVTTADGAPSSPSKRERQKTVVVSRSPVVQHVADVFVKLRENGDFEDAERRILALLAHGEKRTASERADEGRKIQKLEREVEQQMLNLRAISSVFDCSMKKWGDCKDGANGGGPMSNMQAELAQVNREMEKLQSEYETLHTAYKSSFEYIDKLKQLNKDLKEDNDHCREMEKQLKANLEEHFKRYDAMVLNAKTKLNDANVFIKELRDKSDNERLAARHREAAVQSLQTQLDTKITENAELNAICNSLLEKLNVDSTDEDADDYSN